MAGRGKLGALAGILLCLSAQMVVAASSDGDDAVGEALADASSVLPDLAFFRDEGEVSTPRARRELIGLYVNGREIPDGLAVLRRPDGKWLLPLRDLSALIGVTWVEEREAVVVETPLGVARFTIREIERRADEYFVPIDLLAERIAAQIRFDESEYALVVRLLWDPRVRPGVTPVDPIRPDATAPRMSVARLRGEVLLQDDRFGHRESGFLAAQGRLGVGTWHGRLRRDADGETRFEDYHWQLRRGDFAGLVGHQRVGVHPLLPGFELTGMQLAWSNRADRLLASPDPGRLVSDRGAPVRSLRGDGPAGGIAELIIDGIPVSRQRIPLDGRFEFLDVPVPPGFVRIEVALYAPFALGTPLQILDFSGRASDRLLPEGAFLAHAGLGDEGNPLDDLAPEGGSAGFVSLRRSVTGSLTVDVAAQTTEQGEQVALGASVALGPVGVGSMSVARNDGASAHLATLDGDRGPAFWRLSLREEDAGFRPGVNVDVRDRYAEAGWRSWPRWEVSVVARERSGPGQDVDFVKPAARWRPMTGVTLQSRPDSFGDYVHDASWQLSRDTRISARQDRSFRQLSLDHRWSPRWQGSASLTEARDRDLHRASAVVSWQSDDPFGWYADAGVLASESETGFLLRTGRELRPGLRLRFEARRDPLFEGDLETRGTLVLAALSFDFGRAGGAFTRAGSTRAGRGGVGGSIVGVPPGASVDSVAVRINGQVRTRTDTAGRFSVSDLVPGVYRVDLDEEGLPLELSPEDTGFWVEVAEGALTTVQFTVGLRLGAAGRLHFADGTVAEAGSVQVVDDDGRIRARSQATAHGYYRVDGLPPGRYTVQWLADDGSLLAERELALTDTFVFGQDLRAQAATGLSSPNVRSPEDDDER